MTEPVVNDLRDDLREGERTVPWQDRSDAALVFIGRIHTPWTTRAECPRQGQPDGPLCRIEVSEPWDQALDGIEGCERLQIFYWLDRSRRDLVIQRRGHVDEPRGTFALRSPNRPNPIGESVVELDRIEGNSLYVRGLDCVDGTPLVDIKPDRHGCKRPASHHGASGS